MKYADYIAMFEKLEKLEKAYMQAWKGNASKYKLARLASQLNKLDQTIASKKKAIYTIENSIQAYILAYKPCLACKCTHTSASGKRHTNKNNRQTRQSAKKLDTWQTKASQSQ